jgi:hypothetical protein
LNRAGHLAALTALALASAACSREPEPLPQQGSLPAASYANLAAADMGGAVEELTDNYGPGFTGRRLIDGLAAPTWKLDAPVNAGELQALTFPQEMVVSFFEREPAEVEGIELILPNPATLAPKDVEVWVSMDSPTTNFVKVESVTLKARPGAQEVSFSDTEARFVKLKILSGHAPEGLEIAELRVIESDGGGYTPLFERAPLVKHWKGSPREAAQRGLDWLQQAAPIWIKDNNCMGCHVQGQVLMGQAVALKYGYRVNQRSVAELDQQIRDRASYGSWFGDSHSASVFGSMGLTYAAEAMGAKTDKGRVELYPDYSELQYAASNLAKRQAEDGSFPIDHLEPPIVQGLFMPTANALVTLDHALDRGEDPKYREQMERALNWIATHEPETTQDKAFKIIALMHYGTPDHKRLAWSVVETLAAEQQPDGGWKESAEAAGSNAIAAGQVLYAFRQAGISIHGEMFRRGVDYLLTHQDDDPASLDNGAWKAMNTASKRPSGFAHTMWAVIALAGAYGPEPTGALQIVKQEGDKPPARNLAIVLDVSGSMNQKLGDGTRWMTALAMLEDVVKELPDDVNVGLRVYGHRHPSKAAETCRDTQLVVPITKLDRTRILKAASNLRPRGETPLIHSSLQAVNDLKAVGGGSVILITDGEESCGGNPETAAVEIKNSGADVTLNIVGFTLTGEKVEAELGTLAASTGGRYFGAQDGAQLARAVKLAALHRLPYDILDKSGKVLVSGQTSELSRELPPGNYRIRIDALGQVLEEPLTIHAGDTAVLKLGVEGDRFAIRRQGAAS